jgi:hypothetical protein
VQRLTSGQALARKAGAEGQIAGLHLDRVKLSCPEASVDHLESNQYHLESGTTASLKKVNHEQNVRKRPKKNIIICDY